MKQNTQIHLYFNLSILFRKPIFSCYQCICVIKTYFVESLQQIHKKVKTNHQPTDDITYHNTCFDDPPILETKIYFETLYTFPFLDHTTGKSPLHLNYPRLK